MPPALSLDQLKAEAQKQNRRVIRRDGEPGWRPLVYWKGISRDQAVYYLLDDKVLATSPVSASEWYTVW